MVRVYSKTVSGAELISGIVGTVDVGSIIGRAVELATDIDRAKTQLDTLKTWVETQKTVSIKDWEDWAKKGFTEVKDTLLGWYLSHLKDVGEFVRDQAIQSASGFTATATMLGLRLKYLMGFMGTSSLHEAFIGIPQSIFETKAERYWNEKLAPNVPDSRLAFKMMMEGKLSRSEFNKYCSAEGWGSEWHDKLYAVYDTDPDIYMAFGMLKRKIIDFDKLRACFRIAGYDEAWHEKLYMYLHRIPSFYELMRIADYTPLDPIWSAEMLRKNGYEEEVIPRLVEALEKRPIREEVRSVVGRLCWEYETGRRTRDSFLSEMRKLGLLEKEITYWLYWGDLRYQDYLSDLKMDIIEQRVKKGDITTKDDIIKALVGIGWREEVANLIAEKWYWMYLVGRS